MVYAGAGKLFGVFGGKGLEQTLKMFHDMLGIPSWLGMLAIVAEFFGGLAVGLGVASRLGAFGIACTMGVAIYTHASKAQYMDAQLPFSLCAMAVMILCTGAGQIAIEATLFKKKRVKNT